MRKKSILDYANELEGILRRYLNCHYTEFGVKANDNLAGIDWKSPINFALGFCYASSNKDERIKNTIENFLDNDIIGRNIRDVVQNYEYYGFSSEEDAFQYIENVIESLKKILFGR